MDLPEHKKDCALGKNNIWIMRNIQVRNSGHENFTSAQSKLIELAKLQNLIGGSELKRIESSQTA